MARFQECARTPTTFQPCSPIVPASTDSDARAPASDPDLTMEDAPIPSVEGPSGTHEDTANPKPALTPPTSEDMDNRKESMSSELSELDSDDDEEVEPAYYFDGGKIPVFQPVCYIVLVSLLRCSEKPIPCCALLLMSLEFVHS